MSRRTSRRDHRHTRLDPASYMESHDSSYADIPPPTPLPDDSEYEDFQQQQISASSSNLNLQAHSYSQHYIPQVPPYESVLASGTNEHVSPMNRSRSSVSAVHEGEQRPRENKGRDTKKNLKQMGLNFLNAKQHMALALCRDFVLIPPLYHAFRAFAYGLETLHQNEFLQNDSNYISKLTTASPTEYLLTGMWCLVAAYFSYQVIDGLTVRWIVTYQTSAAILRVLSISMFLITIETGALSIFSPSGSYSLHTWILISCVLTGAYIIQNFVTSNLDLKAGNKRRTIDYYNIAVFAVVPVGLASFISVVVLLRLLLIVRLDLSGKELLDGSF
jgi:hypothetical protein